MDVLANAATLESVVIAPTYAIHKYISDTYDTYIQCIQTILKMYLCIESKLSHIREQTVPFPSTS